MSELFQSELDAIGVVCASPGQKSGAPEPWLERPPKDLFGLALSGGGIRSATFGLGLLQGLAELGLLRDLHYLSTVSGGGYIGGFWTSWRFRQSLAAEQRSRVATKEDLEKDFPHSDHSERVGGEAAPVRHLREFSNFLSPRLGLFNMETGNIASVLAASILPSLLAALSAIVLMLYAWVLSAWLVFAYPPDVSLLTILGAILILQVFFEGIWWKCSRPEKKALVTYGVSILLGLVAVGLMWRYYFVDRVLIPEWLALPVPAPWASWIPEGVPFDLAGQGGFAAFLGIFSSLLGGDLLAPAGAAAVGALALVLFRLLGSRGWTTFGRRSRRAAIDRALSRMLLAVAAWLVFAALWRVAAVLIANYQGLGGLSVFGAAGASGGLFSWARKLLGEQPSKPQVGGFTERLKPLIPQILAYLTIALLVVGCAALMIYCASLWDRSLWLRLMPLVVAASVTLFTLVFFNPNEVGLHAFYRSRLARAYLGASNPKGGRASEDHFDDDIRLDQLGFLDSPPLHLVCCAANDLAGDHLANLHRGARSAVLSQVGYSVGEEWTDWKDGYHEPPTLASVMTASGAAFNSHMGSKSMLWGPGVTFLMAALNLRLGLWLPHPRHWKNRMRGSRFLAGLPFYKELISSSKAGTKGSSAVPGVNSEIRACARGKDVHLSDGGHFENMGLYELIRRHCRYIIVSDCGADPDVAFDDLGNAVRLVREDFGVEIDIDLRPLRPGADGLAAQPMVAGDIRYPTGDTGVLLLFKPTLVGNEPADILQYKRRNGAFPHETTGDQFYDEAQWESYRRLGRFAARSAFSFLQGEEWRGAEVFARARFEWRPIPAAARESFPRLAGRVSELEKHLRDERCTRLLREVYKEIDELDRQGKRQVETGTSGDAGADKKAPVSAEKATGLSGDELAASLQVLRLAILFMEEVFFETDLETHADHRINLGWLNYFARWAYSPLFRMWWPLLKSMYHARFTRFLELRFSLPHLQDSTPGVEMVSGWAEPIRREGGFAAECWERHFGKTTEEMARSTRKRFYQYRLKMSYEGRKEPYDIQAALVLLRSLNGLAAWNADEFFVPPGLWGIGFGEDFLKKLPRALGISLLVVRIPEAKPEPPMPRARASEEGDYAPQLRGQGADPVRRRERTTDSQLYRSAGFREAWFDERTGTLLDPATAEPIDPSMDLSALFAPAGGTLDPAEAKKGSWLFLPPVSG